MGFNDLKFSTVTWISVEGSVVPGNLEFFHQELSNEQIKVLSEQTLKRRKEENSRKNSLKSKGTALQGLPAPPTLFIQTNKRAGKVSKKSAAFYDQSCSRIDFRLCREIFVLGAHRPPFYTSLHDLY